MVIKDVYFALKDGREAIIRNPKEGDATQLVDMLFKTAEETPFLLRSPEDCVGRYTVEKEIQVIKDKNSDNNIVFLVCEVDGIVTGTCELSWRTQLRVRHRGSVGIGLLKDYWDLGIGTKMFEVMFNIAKEHGIRQLELDYVEGNVRARALYEKLGFRISGVIPDAIQMSEGIYYNEYSMLKKL